MTPILKFTTALALLVMSQAHSLFAQSDTLDLDAKYATTLLPPGTEAPDFSLQSLDGKTVNLTDFRGKWVVMDIWASWCGDCRQDAPEIARIAETFKSRGVVFLGVSMDTNKDSWQKAIDKYALNYTHVSELKTMRETAIYKLYKVNWIPSIYLIDPEGKVALSTVLSSKLEKTLYEKVPDAQE